MLRQKSFQNDKVTLYIVPTPIGNLQEMTPRAIEILKSVDTIACEDTRVTGKLLHHFEIQTRLIQHHNFNEKQSAQGIIDLLDRGENVAIVSDAGYPLISDPGQWLVQKVIEKGYNVVSLSGCNAMLNALVASGCVVQPFAFIGFLPSTTVACQKALDEYKETPMTLVFYEAPHRIEKMLKNILHTLGDRHVVIARELTKRHEEFLRGSCSELLEEIKKEALKGEIVVIVEGISKNEKPEINLMDITSQVNKSIELGMSKSQAIKEVAKNTGISKNEIYNQLHTSK